MKKINITIDYNDYLPHQIKLFESQYKINCLVGGFGCGKSVTAFTLLTKLFFQKKNQSNGKSFGIIITPNLQISQINFKQPIINFFDEVGIRYNKPKPNMITTKYGDIVFISASQPSKIVAYNATYAIFDEADIGKLQGLKQVFIKTLGRLRGCDNPQFYLTGSPQGYKLLYQLSVESQKKDTQILMIHAKTMDNIHLDKGYIKTIRQNYPKVLLQAYLNGQFVNLTQLPAYSSFDRNINVIKSYVPTQDEVIIGMDFNVDHYSMLFGEILMTGNNKTIVFYDEFRGSNYFTKDAVQYIQNRFPNKKVYIFPDNSGSNRHTNSNITDIQLLQSGKTNKGKFTVYTNPSNPGHIDRLNTVNLAFQHKKIVITEQCVNLILDMQQVTRKQNGSKDKSGETSGRVHCSDAMDYVVYTQLPMSYQIKQIQKHRLGN